MLTKESFGELSRVLPLRGEVAQDGNLITSRKPEDLEAFSSALIAAIERSSKLTAQQTLKIGA